MKRNTVLETKLNSALLSFNPSMVSDSWRKKNTLSFVFEVLIFLNKSSYLIISKKISMYMWLMWHLQLGGQIDVPPIF